MSAEQVQPGKTVDPGTRLLRYLYTGQWRTAQACLEGVGPSSRLIMEPVKFESQEAAPLLAWLTTCLKELRLGVDAPAGSDDCGNLKAVSDLLSERIRRNDFPSEDRMLLVLAACFHWNQPCKAHREWLPLVTRYVDCAPRLFRFMHLRFIFAGRETSRVKKIREARSAEHGVDCTSSSSRCWTHVLQALVHSFYTGKGSKEEFKALVEDVTAHVSGEGWVHKDLIRLAHFSPGKAEEKVLVSYLCHGLEACRKNVPPNLAQENPWLMDYLETVDALHRAPADDPALARSLLEKGDLTWDHVPSRYHKHSEVWHYVANKAPAYVLLKRLRSLSLAKLLSADSTLCKMVADRLSDVSATAPLFGAVDPVTGKTIPVAHRVHPLKAYVTLKLYLDPSLDLKFRTVVLKKAIGLFKNIPKMPPPEPLIQAALRKMLEESFKQLPPTGLRWLVAVDRSQMAVTSSCNYLQCLHVYEAFAVLLHSMLQCEAPGDVDVVALRREGVDRVEGITRESSLESLLAAFSKQPKQTGKVNVSEIFDHMAGTTKTYDVLLVLSTTLGYTLGIPSRPSVAAVAAADGAVGDAGSDAPALATARPPMIPVCFLDDLDRYARARARPGFRVALCGLTTRNLRFSPVVDRRVLYVRGLDHDVPWLLRSFAVNSF